MDAKYILAAGILITLCGAGMVSGDGLFPEGYGIIGQEHYLFPVDMGYWPVKIDSSHQFFVDDYLIKFRAGLEREYHRLQRHPANPVYAPSQRMAGLFYVMRDESGKFRMWYLQRVTYRDQEGNRRRHPTGYIDSDDGIRWREPTLGLVMADGSTENNYVLEKSLEGIFYEPWEQDPARRFKALAHLEPANDENQPEPVEGYWLYVSPDGIHWTRDREDPVAVSLTGYTMPQPGIGDTSSFRWDPVLNKYICNAKFVLPGKYRAYGLCESDDLVHWTRPRMMFYRDEQDPEGMQFYAHYTFDYESMWFGFVKTMEMIETEKGSWKRCELQLSLSRDGRNFTRCPDRTPILPVPESLDAWDMDYPCVAMGEPIRVGDDLWFYYSDRRHWNRTGVESGSDTQMGIATLRVDGFASLNAGAEPGTVVTRPITFQGKSLFVNAEVSDGDYVKAAVQGVWGNAVEPYTLVNCRPLTGDTLGGRITWKGRDTIERLPNESLRLVFELRSAKLYSFWIE